MAATINGKTRLCKIASSGPVPELGGMMAPFNKCKLTDDEIVSIMKRGFKVLEYNPKNQSELKELTLANNGKSPFTEEQTKSPEGEPAEKKPEEDKEPGTPDVLVPNDNKEPDKTSEDPDKKPSEEDRESETPAADPDKIPAEDENTDGVDPEISAAPASNDSSATDKEQGNDTENTPSAEGDGEKTPETEPGKVTNPIVLDTIPSSAANTQASGTKKNTGRKAKK